MRRFLTATASTLFAFWFLWNLGHAQIIGPFESLAQCENLRAQIERAYFPLYGTTTSDCTSDQ